MKKIFTSLFMLIALLCSTTAWAANYDLKVAGIQVTDANKNAITGSGITGSVSYDPSTKTLTLNGATISSTSWGLFNGASSGGGIDELVIELIGSNKISSSLDFATIYSRKTVKIKSAADKVGSLTVENTTTGYGMYLETNADLSVTACHLTVKAPNSIAVYGPGGHSFIANYTWFSFEGTGAMSNFASYYPASNGISNTVVSTVGYSFNSSKKTFVDASGNPATKVEGAPALVINAYPLNASRDYSFSGTDSKIGLTSGSLQYTYSNKTLSLNGVKMTSGTVSYLPGLTINLTGTNTVETSSAICYDLYGNTSFTGTGSLTATSSSSSCVYMNQRWNVSVTVNVNGKVKFKGKNRGIYNSYHSSCPNNDLILINAGSNSDYYFEGESMGSVEGLCHLKLTNMDIYTGSDGTPGSYWDEAARCVKKTGGEMVKGSPVNVYQVKNTYGLKVAGKDVNNCNRWSIGSPYITQGTVKYDSDAMELTFDGAKIDISGATDIYGVRIEASAGAQNIVLNGTNEITSDATVFSSNSPFNITGSGNMTCTSNQKDGISVGAGADVTLNTTGYFIVHAARYGYWGGGAIGEKLTLTKTSSDTFGYGFEGAEGAVHNVSNLVLDGMTINNSGGYLRGCYFDPNTKNINVNGGSLAKGYVSFRTIKEKLPIYVAGEQLCVASGGTDIYVGSPYITGGGATAVFYDGEHKRLTLNNATIENSSSQNTIVAEADVEVQVKGVNKLLSSSAFAALCSKNNANITLYGDGSLTGTSTGYAVYLNCGGALIMGGDVSLDVKGNQGGIGDNNIVSTQRVTIAENAVVRASSITNLSDLTISSNHSIVEPTGAQFENNAVRVGGSIAQNVVIMKVEDYGLEVCDVAVNSYNAEDVFGDGKFSYDNSAKTLFINSATINNTSISNVVKNKTVSDLVIIIQGENTFNVKDNIFELNQSTYITGTGSVIGSLSAADGYGIYLLDAITCVIDGITLDFKGQRAVGGSSADFVMYSGKLIFEPNSSENAFAIRTKTLTLGEGMFITTPEGGQFSTELMAITVDGTTVYQGKVVIEGATAYDLVIAGKSVNSVNCGDILSDGVFKYDDASKTLTICGNYTYTGDDNFIKSYIDNLIINVAGNSMLVSASDRTIIRLYNNTTITGGKLTLMCTAPTNEGLGIYIDNSSTLTIKDAVIDVTGDGFNYAITGESTCQLVIDNSDITASAHSYGAIYDWGGITLTNCFVETPRPSQILENGIADEFGTYVGSESETGTVVIKHGADAIEDINVAQTGTTEVYDAAGRRLNESRRGINIVRTADGKTRKFVKK